MGFKIAIAADIRKFGTNGLTACFGTAAEVLNVLNGPATHTRIGVPSLAVSQTRLGRSAFVLIAEFAPAGDGTTRGRIRH
jgi:hypothetical protein